MVGTELRLQRDMLFKLAVNMYLRSVAIIEQNYGENDLRLVQPLRGLANARMLQITNRKYAEEALERSLAIVESNPESDLSDRAQALVDLGDLYVITSDTRAGETYLSAWHMLQGSPETQEIANLYFGTPLRLFPRESPMLYIDRQPDNTEAGDPLFVELAYNVTTSGKVSGIRLIDKNVPNDHARVLRHKLKTSRYRPRISEGEILETEDLSLRQPFQVFPPLCLHDSGWMPVTTQRRIVTLLTMPIRQTDDQLSPVMNALSCVANPLQAAFPGRARMGIGTTTPAR